MSFDFQAAVSAATSAVAQQNERDSSSSNYKHPLVYPQVGGTIVVRPLFNPASGQIVRLVNRHEKVPCYKSYGIECPICKVQQQVKDLTGQDPFGRTKASRARGVSFAQYISSSYQIDKGNNQILQPGEIILFMYPWSVYSQINTMIQGCAQSPTGMDQAFCHAASGLYIQVQVDANFKYTTTQVPFMTFPTQQTDEEFIKMLEEMESLNTQVIPESITEEVDKQVKEYSDSIYRQFIAPRVAQQGVPAGTAPVSYNPPTPPVNPATYGTPVVPQNNYVAPTVSTPPAPPSGNFTAPAVVAPPVSSVGAPPPQTPASSTPARPQCFGQHTSSPTCICCPEEMNCISCKESGEGLPF